jgi:hypothetical protein
VAAQSLSLFGAARGFFRAAWRAIRQLFHEMTGTLFLLIAASALQSAWRVWQHGATHWLIGVLCAYAALMIVFGVLAFRDSRRVQ